MGVLPAPAPLPLPPSSALPPCPPACLPVQFGVAQALWNDRKVMGCKFTIEDVITAVRVRGGGAGQPLPAREACDAAPIPLLLGRFT